MFTVCMKQQGQPQLAVSGSIITSADVFIGNDVCLSIFKITKKLWIDFSEMFREGVNCDWQKITTVW